jgi:hypothetical protein
MSEFKVWSEVYNDNYNDDSGYNEFGEVLDTIYISKLKDDLRVPKEDWYKEFE